MTRSKRLSALAVAGALILAGGYAPVSHANDPTTPSPVATIAPVENVEDSAVANAAADPTTSASELSPTAEEAPSETVSSAPYADMMAVSAIPFTMNPEITEWGYQLASLPQTVAPYRFSVLGFVWDSASGTPVSFAYRTNDGAAWSDWQTIYANPELSVSDQVIVPESSALEVIVLGDTDSQLAGLNAVLTAFPSGAAPTAQPSAARARTFAATPAVYSSSETQTQFIERIAPLAQADEREWKVPSAVAMAQAILESGWGRSTLTTQYHNYFGIKCWSGQTSTYPTGCVNMETGEYYDGAYLTVTAGFRVYANAQDSFMDHGQFLNVNSRYSPAFKTTNSDDFARAIHAAGYATSPTYSDSLINLMKLYNLYQYDGGGSAAGGEYKVNGWIADAYNAAPSAYGKPTSDEIRPSDRSDVVYQNFQYGRIYAINALGAAVGTKGWIGKEYASRGHQNSPLGYPKSGEARPTDRGDVVYQDFDYGRVYALDSLGKAVSVNGWIGSKYASLGSHSSELGYPTSGEIYPKDRTDVIYQEFSNGRIVVVGSKVTVLSGKINQQYQQVGGASSPLGCPTGDATKINDTYTFQQFEGGRIYLNASGNAYSVHGWIGSKYASLGSHSSELGYPTSGEIYPKNRTDVVYQEFSNGRIVVVGSKVTALSGKMNQQYQLVGGPSSPLGYPTGDATKINDTYTFQQFEGGRIYLNASGNAYSVHGWIGNKYATLGSHSSGLGYPTSGEIYPKDRNDVVYQEFSNGRIYVVGSKVTAITGKYLEQYKAVGGASSPLGYPIADSTKINDSNSYQQFEGGRIYVNSAGVTFWVRGWIGNRYASLGSHTSRLGYPISDETQVSPHYVYQDFQGGRIKVTTANGVEVIYK